MRPDTDVLVVGAGPVGLMLATELRRGGADVIVIDRLKEPTGQSRASTLNARSMEIFDERGLVRGLVPGLDEPPCEQAGHFGGIPLDLSTQPSRYAGQWKVPQPAVERVLGDAAERAGARVHRGFELIDLDQRDDTVAARVSGPTGAHTVRSRYLVGCDGEDSLTRRLAGIGFPGTPASLRILRADLRGVQLKPRRFERLPAGVAISARFADGTTRIMVTQYGVDPMPARPATFEELALVWLRVTGEVVSGATPVWINVFGDASRQAENYRAGRVFLAGDAAHMQLPAGGQAINLGLQDAVNLGWKLAAAVRGHAAADLLDTYHAERHPAGRRVLANVEAQARLLFDPGRSTGARELMAELIEQPAVRDLLAGVISGLDVRYEPGDHPLVGRRAPALTAVHCGFPATTTELLRAGRGLLLDFHGNLPRLDLIAAGWAGRVDLVTADPEPGCVDVDVMLVRPDGFVAWAGGVRSGLLSAMRRWFGRPVRTR